MLPLILLLVFLSVSANAQRIVGGSCPNFPTEQSFDITEFLGNWVETEKTPSIFDFVMRCLEVDYKYEKGGALNVNLRGLSLGGLPISITGDGVIHDTSRNGVYNVRYVFGVPFQGTLMTVLDTDYKEYAVLYSCTNSILPRVFHTEYIWILTRDGVLSNPSRQNIYEKLDALKINRNNLQLSDRFNCPARNASATPAREEPQVSPVASAVPLASFVKNSIKPASAAVVPTSASQTATVNAPIIPSTSVVTSSASAPVVPLAVSSINTIESASSVATSSSSASNEKIEEITPIEIVNILKEH